MEIPILMILLSCTYSAIAYHGSHQTIPIEGYESSLQDLGQHVEIPETPVRVIKITKTVAVKIPVPYPVKIREKVPYPVPVAKPYPVPVPQIIKVPHFATPQSGHEQNTGYGANIHGGQEGSSYSPYQVQENEPSLESHSFGPASGSHSFDGAGADSRQGHNYDGDFSYEGTPGSYDSSNDESKSYDQAINDYFNKQQPSDVGGSSGQYH